MNFTHLNSPNIEYIKKRICSELANNEYVVKPEIRSNLQYLYVLFSKRMEDHAKDMQRNERLLKPRRKITIIDNPDDMKTSILQSIKKWSHENKDSFGLSE